MSAFGGKADIDHPLLIDLAEIVRLSRTSIADEMREEHQRRVLGERGTQSCLVVVAIAAAVW
jgi:hypothetical protein